MKIASAFVILGLIGLVAGTSQAQSAVSVTPATSMPTAAVGGTGGPFTVIVTNNSQAPLTVGAAMIDGADAPAFRGDSNTCYLQTLQPGQLCTISLAFTPFRSGSHAATLHVGDLNGDPTVAVGVSGNATGTTPTYAPVQYQLTDLSAYWPDFGPEACGPDAFTVAGQWCIEGSAIFGFNNHGVLSGVSYVDEDGENYYGRSFYISSQGLTYVPLPTPNYSACCDNWGNLIPPSEYVPLINDSGQIVASGTAPSVLGYLPFLFTIGSGSNWLQDLVTNGYSFTASSDAQYLANNGDIFITTTDGIGPVFLLFSSGAVKAIQLPSGIDFYTSKTFDATTEQIVTLAPWVNVGSWNQPGIAPASWNASGTFRAGIIVSGVSLPFVNSSGSFLSHDDPNNPNTAFLWTRGLGAQSLLSLIPSGWSLGELRGFNDLGQILAFARDTSNVRRLVLLSPIASTPVGTNVAVQSGNTTLQFSSVNTDGITTVQQIDPSTTGQVPGGYAISDLMAFQINTTASFSGPVTLGFVVTGPISQADFNNLRILHNENGNLVDITTSYDYTRLTIYGTTTSFSPFYIARKGPHVVPLFDQSKAYKLGSTIPIKLQIADAANVNVSSAGTVLAARKLLRIQNASAATIVDAGNSNPDYNFRFDPTIGGTGGYIFNLSTKGLTSGKYSLSFYMGSDKQYVYSVAFDVR